MAGAKGMRMTPARSVLHRAGAAAALRLAPLLLASLLLALAAAGPHAALAAESAPVTSTRVTATLVSDTDAYAPEHPFHLALRLRMAPGWHTYWTNPGDAGAATTLSFTLPQGLQNSPVAWPAPERLLEGDLAAYAYTGDLLLPVAVTGPATGTLPLRAHAEWLVCSTLCVPESGDFALDLPAGNGTPSAQAPLFAQAAARTPGPSPFLAHVAPDGTLSLSGREIGPAAVRDAYFFPAAPAVLTQSAPQPLSVGDGTLSLRLPVAPGFDSRAGLGGVLQLTDAHGGKSWLDIAATPGPASPPASGAGLLRALLLAFAGGLVLNLMPCVFPVLAMKAMALARLSGATRTEVRRQAGGYTLGVLAAFAALGGVMLALRGAGAAAGWGFQFQSPVFVTGTAWVLFAVGLGLSGVVTPVTGLEGVGQGLASRGGLLGSVSTGLLAVLVATPCTAPFMGAAIAAALAAPPRAGDGGVPRPWASASPLPYRAPRRRPAPGPRPAPARAPGWTCSSRRAGLPDVRRERSGSLWVAQPSRPARPACWPASPARLATGFAAWAWGASRGAERTGRRAGGLASLLGAAAAAAILVSLARLAARRRGDRRRAPASDGSEPFSTPAPRRPARPGPPGLRRHDRRLVRHLPGQRARRPRAPARAATPSPGRDVAYLKGDWTRQDPQITAFLREHGRDGVPLYVFYPPGGCPPERPPADSHPLRRPGRARPGLKQAWALPKPARASRPGLAFLREAIQGASLGGV